MEAGDGHEQEVDGEAKLRKSAHRAVAEKSGAIADKLAEQAANGNVVSAKFLVDLITKKSAPVKRHSTINSRFIGDMEREPEYVETPLERKTE